MEDWAKMDEKMKQVKETIAQLKKGQEERERATNTQIPDCRNAEHSGLSDIKRRYDIIAEKYRNLLEATQQHSNIVDRCNADILERATIAEKMAETSEKRYEALQERFHDLGIKYDENLKERVVLKDKVEEAEQQLRKKDAEYDSLEENCKYAEKQATEANEAIQKLEMKITELESRNPAFEAQVKRDKEYIDHVEKEVKLRDANIQSLEDKLKRKDEDLQQVSEQRDLIRTERNNVHDKNDAYYQDNTGIKKLLETALEEKRQLISKHKDALRRIAELEETELNLTDEKATTDDLIAKIRDQMPAFDLNPKAYVIEDPSPSPSLKRKQVEAKVTAVPPTLESELSDVDLYSASSGEESGEEREDATDQPEPEMRFADPDRLGELQVPGAATVYVNVPGRGRIVYQLVEVEVPGPEREVERIVEVPGPTVEVPGPERVVEGPERIVEVKGPTIYVDVPGPERVVQGPISYVEGQGSIRYLPFRTSSHNPITCWFMTEFNALMLFLYFLKSALSTSPDNGPIHLNDLPPSPPGIPPQDASPDDETTPTEAEPSRFADLAEILGPVNEENRGETIPSSSRAQAPRQRNGQSRRMYQMMDKIQPDQQHPAPASRQVTSHLVPQQLRTYLNSLDPADEPHFLSTIFALLAHFIFYYGLYVCYCAYYERELWLSANAGTRALLARLSHRGRHPRGILHWFLSEWMAARIDRLIIFSVQLFGVQFKAFPIPG